ncbi:MAG: hypothetical protein NC328_02625 [Muribaculum sp.]|nr:hypothetical protein [Muribaculum sp.]
MKKLFILTVVSVALIGTGCSSKTGKQIEESEETAAEIEAAMMAGRNAAKEFVTEQWSDTFGLQRRLLDVRAQSSKYTIDKKPRSAAAFDSTFVSTMRTVRPELADQLQKHYK